jgi:hypothetical protein
MRDFYSTRCEVAIRVADVTMPSEWPATSSCTTRKAKLVGVADESGEGVAG